MSTLCSWVWNGYLWVEDPDNPHHCAAGSHCGVPTTPGTYYGQYTTTLCVVDDGP